MPVAGMAADDAHDLRIVLVGDHHVRLKERITRGHRHHAPLPVEVGLHPGIVIGVAGRAADAGAPERRRERGTEYGDHVTDTTHPDAARFDLDAMLADLRTLVEVESHHQRAPGCGNVQPLDDGAFESALLTQGKAEQLGRFGGLLGAFKVNGLGTGGFNQGLGQVADAGDDEPDRLRLQAAAEAEAKRAELHARCLGLQADIAATETKAATLESEFQTRSAELAAAEQAKQDELGRVEQILQERSGELAAAGGLPEEERDRDDN